MSQQEHVALKRVDVVIVNWNAGAQLRRCLESLQQTEPGLCEVTVVDNKSEDDSLDDIVADRVIRNCRNLGFAAACNQGAAAGSAPYVLFLNPDTVLEPGAVGSALGCLASNPQLGVVGVQLRDEQGVVQRSCARQPTAGTMVAEALGVSRLWPRTGYLMTEWDHRDDRVVEHVIGAFYLMRRELFESLGGFSESFFLYLEDLDLSRRVLDAGFQLHFLSSAKVMHVGGGTSRRIPAKRLFYALRARLLFARKHFSRPGIWCVTLATVLLEPMVRLLFQSRARSPGTRRDTLRAYGALYRWLLRS